MVFQVSDQEKFNFNEAKSVLRNPSKWSDKKFKESKILVANHYAKNPHLLQPIKKVDKSYLDSEEYKKMKLKYQIN
jgi:hypothetical protein